jgi:hypothetical protein
MYSELNSLNSNTNKKNYFYYIVGGSLLAGVLGGVYYIYNRFSKEEKLSEDTIFQIEEIKNEIEETNGELTVEVAIKISFLANQEAEDIFILKKPDLEVRRRNTLNNISEYEKICKEMLEAKQKCLLGVLKKILNHLGGVSITDFNKIIRKVHPYDLESNFSYNKFEHSNLENDQPDKNLVKEAFKFLGEKYIEEMESYKKLIQSEGENCNMDKKKEEFLFFKLTVAKLRADDMLFLKYKYTEAQLRYLIYKYQMIEDLEIKNVSEAMARVFES